MRDGPAVNTLDEREFEDAVRWLREQYRLDLAVLRRWPPRGERCDASGSGPWAVRTVAAQAAQFDVAVDAIRHAFRADDQIHPALVAELKSTPHEVPESSRVQAMARSWKLTARIRHEAKARAAATLVVSSRMVMVVALALRQPLPGG